MSPLDRTPLAAQRALQPLLALRLAARSLRSDPMTAVLAALTLALGLSFSATLFSLLDGATRDLPVPRGHEVVRIDVVQPSAGGRGLSVDTATVQAWRESADGLQAIGRFRETEITFDDAEGFARRRSAAELSPEVLPLLGVAPVLGRRFTADDRDAGVLLIGYRAWQEDFAGDPRVVGSEVRVGDRQLTVIGVMPPDFGFPFSHSAWMPLPDEAASGLQIVGRMQEGVEARAVATELTTTWQRADSARPEPERGGQVAVAGFTSGRGEGGEGMAFAALGAIVFGLLLVACLNTSTLLLVRAARRRRLIGIQAALGAGRGQVALQALIEAVLIALAGAAAGLALTWVAVEYIDRVISAHFGYYWMRVALDGPVVAFGAVLMIVAAVVAGTVPAVRAARVDPHVVLKSGGPGAAGSLGRAATFFIGVQVAAATVSLVTAFLMAGGLVAWGGWENMLPSEDVLIAAYDVGDAASGRDADDTAATAAAREFRQRLLADLGEPRAAIGIGTVGFAEPFSDFELEGEQPARDIDRLRTVWNAVTPSYLELFGLATVAGQPFANATGAEVVVSRSFVSRFLDGGDAIGRRVRVAAATGERWATVVGVVEDISDRNAGEARNSHIYFPIEQVEPARAMVLVPGGTDLPATSARLRAAARSANPDVALERLQTMNELVTYLTRMPRVIGLTAVAGATAGLLVMAVGLYGLLSFYVRQHLFELGVRMAVGADGSSIARVVLRRAAAMMLPGMLVGLAIIYAAAPLFGVFLFGVAARRPLPFLLVALALSLVGLLASAGPLRRALNVEPAVVLRGD